MTHLIDEVVILLLCLGHLDQGPVKVKLLPVTWLFRWYCLEARSDSILYYILALVKYSKHKITASQEESAVVVSGDET